MAKKKSETIERQIIKKHFPEEASDMALLEEERRENAVALANALAARIVAERERTMAKPADGRTSEETKHAKRIVKAQDNLGSSGGE